MSHRIRKIKKLFKIGRGWHGERRRHSIARIFGRTFSSGKNALRKLNETKISVPRLTLEQKMRIRHGARATGRSAKSFAEKFRPKPKNIFKEMGIDVV